MNFAAKLLKFFYLSELFSIFNTKNRERVVHSGSNRRSLFYLLSKKGCLLKTFGS